VADSGALIVLEGDEIDVAGRLGGEGDIAQNSNASTTVEDGAIFDPGYFGAEGGTMTVNGSGTLGLPTVGMSGGTFDGTRNRSIDTLYAMAGTLGGTNTTTVAVFSKTIGELTIGSGLTLALSGEANFTTGDICIDGTLRIENTFTIGVGAGDLACGSGGHIDLTAPNGRLTSTGSGTFNFNVHVNSAGEIDLGDAPAFNFQAGLTLLAGGSLTGIGTAGGEITNQAGVVRPGASPGVLTIDGDYTQGPGGTLEVELNGTTPETEFDVLDVTGDAQLAGKLHIVRGSGFTPSGTTTFQIVKSTSRSGAFALLDGTALPGGKHLGATYPAGPDFGARLTVQNRGCTIVGSAGANAITGTGGNDYICSEGGLDLVHGGAGNDIIDLGAGNDTGYGEGGNDRLIGGSGKDRVWGGSGRDFLVLRDRSADFGNGGTGTDTARIDRRDTLRRVERRI
jgi:Ca2+-binding RTX toxin-like protein